MIASIKYPGLRAEMAQSQLTIKDLAEEIGTHRDTLSKWLTCKRDLPLPKSVEIRDKRFPGKSLDELYGTQ